MTLEGRIFCGAMWIMNQPQEIKNKALSIIYNRKNSRVSNNLPKHLLVELKKSAKNYF